MCPLTEESDPERKLLRTPGPANENSNGFTIRYFFSTLQTFSRRCDRKSLETAVLRPVFHSGRGFPICIFPPPVCDKMQKKIPGPAADVSKGFAGMSALRADFFLMELWKIVLHSRILK